MINEFKTETTTEAATTEATTAKTETAMSEQATAKTADTVVATSPATSATTSATAVNMPEWMRDLTPMNLEVTTQLKNHSIRSIINLINTIYTWGQFISIITGAHFKAGKYLVNTINKRKFESREELLAYVKEQTERGVGLTGVRFEEGKNSNSEETEEETEVGDAGEVIFDGFKGVPFANNCGTYSRLMFHINKNALERKSIKARDLTDEEMRDGKRTFAAWLTSIGMKDDADTDGVFADDRERLLTLVEGVMRAVRARAARRAAAAKAAEKAETATKAAVAGM